MTGSSKNRKEDSYTACTVLYVPTQIYVCISKFVDRIFLEKYGNVADPDPAKKFRDVADPDPARNYIVT